MLNQTQVLLKKGWTYNPGRMNRGGKNLTWRPKMGEDQLRPFLFLDFEHPRRRPASWDRYEFRRLGMVEWPKEVGFFNAGDNFELTPEMSWRLFEKNKDQQQDAEGAAFWTPEDNERTVVNLLPFVEKAPEQYLPRVEEIFRSHVERFGVDHIIYNAVMQAVAFARDLPRCKEIFAEMKAQGLEPNAQSYVNMMLAVRLAAEPGSMEDKEKLASEYFVEAVRTGALKAVMRLDTEFRMWWDQLERMGSFTEEGGFLSNKEEGAQPRPRDIWSLWGWDSREERKFIPRHTAIRQQVGGQERAAGNSLGTVWNSYKREPWHRYKGMRREDFAGPNMMPLRQGFKRSPAPLKNSETCGASY